MSKTPDLDVAGGDVVFVGTIVTVEPYAPSGTLQHAWAVTARVDKVVVGKLDGSKFSFLVHSPAKSGLSVGGRYRIAAKRTADGYLVDQSQWRGVR